MRFADFAFAVDGIGNPATGTEDRQKIRLAKIARFQQGRQRIAWTEFRNRSPCLLIVFDEPEQQSAKRFFLACPAVTFFEQRFDAVGRPFEFRITFDDPRQRSRKQFGILTAIKRAATSRPSSKRLGRIPRA